MDVSEKCGIFGIASKHGGASEVVYFGLYALQHRGQESAGIGVSDNGKIHLHKAEGTIDWVFRKQIPLAERVAFTKKNSDMPECDLVDEVAEFERSNEKRILAQLPGNIAIGHVRYSTTGVSGNKNIHPILFYFKGEAALIAHNGNIVRLKELINTVEERGGYSFEGTTDTEVIAALISTSSKETFYEALLETLPLLDGAFSLVLLHKDTIYAIKDRFGIRPLCIGRTKDSYIAASETCALDTVEAEFLKELEPGEGAILRPDSLGYFKWSNRTSWRSCIFEFLYFSRPDSMLRARSIDEVRKNAGKLLARQCRVLNADVITPVPDSGNSAALGYAIEFFEQTGRFLYDNAIVRPHGGRTFIDPVVERRQEFRRIKYSPKRPSVKGKIIVLVDDSIVRGTTSPYILGLLKRLGAKEVHIRVASPPLRYPCHLGVDLPWRTDYIANGVDAPGNIRERTVEEIRQEIERLAGVKLDSLAYLSLEGLIDSIKLPESSFCTGCFNNSYPLPPEDEATYQPKGE